MLLQLLFYVCKCLSAYVHMCINMWCREVERTLDPLELEIKTVVN